MASDRERTLALFFTLGVSLQTWSEAGILDRELALYEELVDEFDRILLFTYGGRSDAFVLDDESPFEVVHRTLPSAVLYSLLLPIIHRSALRDVDVMKTNQMLGSWAAVLAKFLHGGTLVIRTGYVLSTFYRRMGRIWLLRAGATLAEWIAYRAADVIITSSEHGYEYVEDRYRPQGRHVVIPNYIETDVFEPLEMEPERDLCFIGRLAPQKNLEALLEALDGSGRTLTIIGEGPLESELRTLVASLDVDAVFRGRLPNHRLPEIINRHRVFVMPSHFEGMPKALLEAMACGVAVVATDVPGNNEVVEDGTTGLLCGTDPGALRTAIERILSDTDLRDRLGRTARETLVDQYSLEVVAARERSLYRSVQA